MKTWKIITVLLAVLLLAGCVGCASGAVISSVDLKITAPSTGVEKMSATTSTPGVTVLSTEWSPVVSSTFNANEVYTVKVTLTNSSKDYSFASPVGVLINSKEVIPVTPSNNEITISYTFPKTAAPSVISEIAVSLAEPLAAQKPSATVTIKSPTSGLKSSVVWNTTDKFVLGKNYVATITLESTNSKAYPLSSSATVKINGVKIDEKYITRSDNSKITVIQTFEAEPQGTASSFVFTLNAPSVGDKPATAVTVNSQSAMTTTMLTWSPTHVSFEPDTEYTATITVIPKDGYAISSSATAKVNGVSVTPVWEKNTDGWVVKGTLSYTFAKIESVNNVDVTFDSPATGNVAPTKATSISTSPIGSANVASISWAPALLEGEFESGTEYTATVTIPIVSSSNTAFDKDTIVYINGNKAEIVSVSANSIQAAYTFPKTFFFPNPLDIIKEFFQLMLAIFNPASYVFL